MPLALAQLPALTTLLLMQQAIRDSIEIQSNARKAGREAQSGPRGELQAIRKERKAKIEEKKAIREQLNTMKRVDLVRSTRTPNFAFFRPLFRHI